MDSHHNNVSLFLCQHTSVVSLKYLYSHQSVDTPFVVPAKRESSVFVDSGSPALRTFARNDGANATSYLRDTALAYASYARVFSRQGCAEAFASFLSPAAA